MWVLTCDGDLFGGKRVWLRPGTTHLLGRTTGRTENGERLQYINHKSVSRKHLTIEIGPVKDGDSSRLHTRSEIKLTDGSKIGTTLNGQKFLGETKTLHKKEYTISLGSYEPLFHLKWHPVTLSFTSVPKKSKDPLAGPRAKLEQADVKLITDYVTNETTHAIAKKRNTPAALQALIQARWLVTDGFADALADSVEQRGGDNTSLLEEDFDGNWPKEVDNLVPCGGEPNPRSDQYIKPNEDRTEVFQNYAFIFLSQSQCDNLLPVITAGSGKALFKEVQPGESRFEDVVEYAKEAAGNKGVGHFKLSQQTGRGGVIIVRPNERDEAWRAFIRSIDLALDQRSIEQNEFLDAILTVDATVLRKQLEEEPENVNCTDSATSPPHPPGQAAEQQPRAVTLADSPPDAEHEPPPTAEEPREEQPEQPPEAPRMRYRRVIKQPRFKGFDDFDPSQFSKPAERSPEPSGNDYNQASQASGVRSPDIDEASQASRGQHGSRKRPLPTHDDEEEEEQKGMYASILTGHAAVKRQKTEADQSRDRDGLAETSTAKERAAAEQAAQQKQQIKHMNVRAEVTARRKRVDEARRKDEEDLHVALTEDEINNLRNLAEVEELEIPLRERPAGATDANGRSERWDPAWNGRKNFKKFRPQGQRGDNAPRLQRVIVPLQEVPRKGHGIGDEYWLTTIRSKSKSQSQSQSQTLRQGAARSQQNNDEDEEEDEEAVLFRRRLQNSWLADEEDARVANVLPEEIAGRPRDDALQAAVDGSQQTAVQKAPGKRPAATQGGREPKKTTQSRIAASWRGSASQAINLEDDDDQLKFRRRRQ